MSWSTTWPESKPVQGTAAFPSVRYSASAVSYGGELVVTPGYVYDHQHHRPAWQSNAWAFNYARREWRRVHEGEKAGAPSARYCMSAVVFDDRVVELPDRPQALAGDRSCADDVPAASPSLRGTANK